MTWSVEVKSDAVRLPVTATASRSTFPPLVAWKVPATVGLSETEVAPLVSGTK